MHTPLHPHFYNLNLYLYLYLDLDLDLNLDLNLDPNFDLSLDLDYPYTTLIPTLTPTLIPTTMALMEKEWAAMASKYGYGIDADKAIKDKLVEFIQTMIYIYETQDHLIDNDL